MSIFITILVTIAALIVVLLAMALFVKKEYMIEREIIINKPVREVFDYVKFLRNQDHYSKWVRTDPNMKKDFRGTDGTEGFVYAWDSTDKNAGKGEQEIKKITEGEVVDVEVRFERPFEGVAKAPIKTESVSADQTKVRWGMEGKSKYPMNLMNLFMLNMLGKDLETSLSDLKRILENNSFKA